MVVTPVGIITHDAICIHAVRVPAVLTEAFFQSRLQRPLMYPVIGFHSNTPALVKGAVNTVFPGAFDTHEISHRKHCQYHKRQEHCSLDCIETFSTSSHNCIPCRLSLRLPLSLRSIPVSGSPCHSFFACLSAQDPVSWIS